MPYLHFMNESMAFICVSCNVFQVFHQYILSICVECTHCLGCIGVYVWLLFLNYVFVMQL